MVLLKKVGCMSDSSQSRFNLEHCGVKWDGRGRGRWESRICCSIRIGWCSTTRTKTGCCSVDKAYCGVEDEGIGDDVTSLVDAATSTIK